MMHIQMVLRQQAGLMLLRRSLVTASSMPTAASSTSTSGVFRTHVGKSSISSVSPLFCIASRGIKVKPSSSGTQDQPSSSSSAGSSSSSSSGPSSEGMDLFSRALAAQKARQAAQHAAANANSTSPPSSSSTAEQSTSQQQSSSSRTTASSSSSSSQRFEDIEEPLSPEDEERIRRLKERAEAQELKRVKGRSKIFFGLLLATLAGTYVYAGLPSASEVEKGTAALGLLGHHQRAWKSLTGGYKEVTGSATKSLLPDPLPGHYQKRNTLFVELSDTLVHMTWDKSLGWRAATRPGVKEFLSYLTRYYEIVIFTNSHNYIAQPVIDALDPYGYTLYKLYRDSTRLYRGKNVKDLSMTNRDLSRCVIVDWDPKAYQLQPENGVPVKRWKLEKDDRELAKVMTFLEEIALFQELQQEPDIRKIMKVAKDHNPENPVEGWNDFKKKLRVAHDKVILDQANDQRQRFNQPKFQSVDELLDSRRLMPSLNKGSAVNSILGSIAGALFGGRTSITQASAQTGTASLTGGTSLSDAAGAEKDGPGYGNVVDAIEYHARMERRSFASQREQMMKQVEADYKKHNDEIERQINEMKAQKIKLKDWFLSGPPQIGAPQTTTPSAAPA